MITVANSVVPIGILILCGAFNGVKEIELEHGYKFHGQETAPGSLALTGKITGTNHPFVEHFKFVKQFEDENTTPRQTILLLLNS